MMRNDLGKLRYRLYARKSTDTSEKQVQSLDDQVKYMKQIAKHQGLHIIGDPICEAKSAKLPHNRPLFAAMLREIEAGEIDGIICWKLDRLSRNPTESGLIQQLLQDEKLKHILVNDKNYFPEDNAIIMSVESGMSNQQIRDLSTGTKRGMKSKAEDGGKNGVPPIGYLNDKFHKTIVPDPDRYELIRILWDKMLTGTYSIAELTKVAKDELNILSVRRTKIGGNPIAYSTLCMMFKNPFYAGKIRFHGTIFDGKHKAMVTEEEFEKVQSIIDPTHTTRPKDKEYNFQFRNLFRCGECGFAITAEQKHKTIKSTGEVRKYIYYHCTGKSKVIKCSQPSLHINEDQLIKQLKTKLNSFTIDPDFYQLAIEALAQEEDNVVEKDVAKTAARDKAIEKNKLSITNLRRMRYSGEADDDTWYYAEMKTLEDELEALQKQRNNAEYKARDWRAKADEVFTFARYAKEDFDSDDLEKKRTVIMRLGEKLALLDRTLQFVPNKYFIPIEKMNESRMQLCEMVRTSPDKIKTPAEMQMSLSWLRRLDSNQQPRS